MVGFKDSFSTAVMCYRQLKIWGWMLKGNVKVVVGCHIPHKTLAHPITPGMGSAQLAGASFQSHDLQEGV